MAAHGGHGAKGAFVHPTDFWCKWQKQSASGQSGEADGDKPLKF